MKKVLLNACIIFISTLVIFIFIEGFSSVLLTLTSLHHKTVAERVYTRYDPLLGWASVPGKYLKNMYGQGIYLKINTQGFRSNVDFSKSVPEGKIRAICSGDSFTFGYGVDNDHTWCQTLSTLDPRLETVNMGQGGYGIDQAYLWYMRDGLDLDHQLHIFALIADDVNRDGSSFLGYGKPYFKLQNGSLMECNVPVPKLALSFPWLTENMEQIGGLSSVKLFGKIFRYFFPFTRAFAADETQRQDANEIALKIFDEMIKADRSRQVQTVVVYLPTLDDLEGSDSSRAALRALLRSELSKRGVPFVDLFEDFKRLPSVEMHKMYINKLARYRYSVGHYSNDGNLYVARLLEQRITPYLRTEDLQ